MNEQDVMSALGEALTRGGWLWSHHPDSRRLRGSPGQPDIVAVHPKTGCIRMIEAKGEGGKLSEAQQDWAAALGKNYSDQIYMLVKPHSLELACKLLINERTNRRQQ